MNNIQENELIVRILQGRRQEYAILVDRYKKPIFNLIYWMTGNRQDADDLAQETFVRAYLKLNTFNTGQRFSPWLYAICLNLTRSHLRQQKKLSDRPYIAGLEKSLENPFPGGGMEGGLINKERYETLQATLMKMSDDDREVIILRFFDERSLEEIAEIEGSSLSATKMRLYRGLKKMKTMFSEKDR